MPAAAAQLHAMAIVAVARGWDLQITSGFRSWRSQERLYVGYQRWLDAGRPARDSVEWEQGMHDLAVGRPGFGTHQSGRAVDVRLSKWLGSGASMRDLWELMEAHGFRPFYTLDRPDADASEAWHFDFYGEWQRAFKQLGYRGGMLCCTADVGLLAPAYVSRRRNRAVQAQLTRAGADIGAIDGWIGARTRAGARDLGVDLSEPDDSLFESLFALPTVHA